MFYADRVTNPKFNQGPIVKPLLRSDKPKRPPSVKYTKFGPNLGPSRPVPSTDKYRNLGNPVQSPIMFVQKARRDFADSFVANHQHLAKKVQNQLNEHRKSHFSAPRQTRNTLTNLTYSQVGVNNTLQSPCFYRSINRPSNTKAVDEMNQSIERQTLDKFKHLQRTFCYSSTPKHNGEDKKMKSPFLLNSMRKMVNTQPKTPDRAVLTRSKSTTIKSPFDAAGFMVQYQNATQMLRQGHSKALLGKNSAASSLAMAVPQYTQQQAHRRAQSVTNSHTLLGLRRNTVGQVAQKTTPEFFKTNNQHAFDQLKVATTFHREPVREFSFTRYKQRAPTNYDSMPLQSRHKAVDNRQPDFQMRITVDNGEPGLPVSNSSVYSPIKDQKRFNSSLLPQQDVYRENLCQSFISVKNSTILQSSQARRGTAKGNRAVSGTADKYGILGMKRKHGAGLFKQRVAFKPNHVIDSF